jgi:hypothetical protein
MAWDTFTCLIDRLPTLTELQLQGLGEPMMHPRFFDMIAYSARRGIRVGTNSNLTLLNPQRAERCVTSGLDELNISLDGARAEIYERIRMRAHLDRVLGNLGLPIVSVSARCSCGICAMTLPNPRCRLIIGRCAFSSTNRRC